MKRRNKKRIERMLKQQNLEVEEIYSGPISNWVMIAVYLSMGVFPAVFYLPWLMSIWLAFLVIGYFYAAYHCNSFGLNHTHLYTINPYFPFQKIESIPLADIQTVRFYVDRKKWKMFFFMEEINYVEIQTPEKTIKFPCFGLEADSDEFDFSPNTMADLNVALLNNGLAIAYEM